jgi:hypothetical protein
MMSLHLVLLYIRTTSDVVSTLLVSDPYHEPLVGWLPVGAPLVGLIFPVCGCILYV